MDHKDQTGEGALMSYTASPEGSNGLTLHVDWPLDTYGESYNGSGPPNSNLSSNETRTDTGPLYSLPALITIACILAFVIIMTILGNLLVIVTVGTTRRLQTPTNYFILSLSVTDLLLGIVVLPFSALNTVHPSWPLGGIFCNIFIANDVMLCTVSILTLFAISLDRYFSVTMPLKYDQKMTTRIVVMVTVATWIFSAAMSYIPIHAGWNTPTLEVQNLAEPHMCVFLLNKPYTLLIAACTYFTPLIVMCGVYLKILNITKHQVREINKLTMPSRQSDGLSNGHGSGDGRRKEHNRMVSDRKATVTLASIVLAFAVCWVPYFVIFTVKPFLSGEASINPHFDLFCLWLGYANSMINPFLYGFYNSVYRDSFKKILCRGCVEPQKKYNALHIGHKQMRNGSGISESSELTMMKKNSTVITFMQNEK